MMERKSCAFRARATLVLLPLVAACSGGAPAYDAELRLQVRGPEDAAAFDVILDVARGAVEQDVEALRLTADGRAEADAAVSPTPDEVTLVADEEGIYYLTSDPAGEKLRSRMLIMDGALAVDLDPGETFDVSGRLESGHQITVLGTVVEVRR